MPVVSRPASEPAWFKSSYSGGNATECLEAAFIPSGVLVRDSKRPAEPHLTVSARAWADFLAATPCSH
ncbi:DUF397 domain-containing protein [Streptomyces justiciae]|uniref:DUF397 domain-containing protein n=1 Tax=Streptomyces justiciae TaxID=2780140 RepID=UPI00187F9EBE|nr:DUF397 domain-containing protein [Streptomyces justiciae]MBE8469518.1 DUF397 domain-containing protein [Streptomyces justiciae]